MLELTECLGAHVIDADGTGLGKLVDLAAGLNDPYPIVSRLRVRTPQRSACYVTWEKIASFADTGVRLSIRTNELESADTLPPDELLLAEHVLDTQIVDIKGKRVVRVGEVELTAEEENLLVVGVEVGRAALLRRLGLRRLSRGVSPELVDWRDLHVASGRGHALQLGTTAARVHRLSASELADLVSRMPLTHGAEVLRAVKPSAAASALGAAHPELGGRLVGELDPNEAALILAEMQVDRAAHALRHMTDDKSERAVARLPEQRAEQLRQLRTAPLERAPAPTPVRRRFRKVLSARRRAPS